MAETKTSGTKKDAGTKVVEKKEAPVEKKQEKPVAQKKTESKKEQPKKVKKEKSYKIVRSKESSAKAKEKSRLEKKKGKFKRQNFGKVKKIKDRWRRPNGIDSGHQKDEKSKPAHPRTGYMTPKHVKGLHFTGYEQIRVFNVDGLKDLDNKVQAIIIASAVGNKKRAEIQKIAQEKNIAILNYKEINNG